MYKKFLNTAPFIMVLITGITSVVSSIGWYHKAFVYLPDLLGYSILTNLIFLRIYKSNKYCHSTRVAVYGLITMNVVSILTKKTIYYNSLHDLYISFVVIAIIVYTKKPKLRKWI